MCTQIIKVLLLGLNVLHSSGYGGAQNVQSFFVVSSCKTNLLLIYVVLELIRSCRCDFELLRCMPCKVAMLHPYSDGDVRVIGVSPTASRSSEQCVTNRFLSAT